MERSVLSRLRCKLSAGNDFSGETYRYRNDISEYTALTIHNAVRLAKLEVSNAKLVRSHDATVAGWNQALDLRDKETEGHSQSVTEMTMLLTQALGGSEANKVDTT